MPTQSIPNNTLVEYLGTWTTTTWSDSNSIVPRVLAAIAQRGLTVKTYKVNAPFVQIGPTQFTITIVVQVTNGGGFGNVNDVAKIIDHEAYQVTGNVAASSIPSYTPPASSPVQTGQPTQPVQDGGSSWWTTVIGQLKTAGVAGTLGLALGAALVILLAIQLGVTRR